jgi:polyhydroxyalkanoate synthase
MRGRKTTGANKPKQGARSIALDANVAQTKRAARAAQVHKEIDLRHDEPDDPDTMLRERFDRLAHAVMGRLSLQISPLALGLAYADWLIHLAASPGKQAELVTKITRKWTRFLNYAMRTALTPNCPLCIEPLP